MSDTHEMLKAQVDAHRASVERLYDIANHEGITRADILFICREGRELNMADHFPEGLLEGSPADEAEWELDMVREAAQELLDEAPLSIEGIWKGESAHKALYQGCTVVFGTGGPHVELDTVKRQWIGYWGGETVYRMADPDLCDYYDGLMEG